MQNDSLVTTQHGNVHRYHVYQDVWKSSIGEKLVADKQAVKVVLGN